MVGWKMVSGVYIFEDGAALEKHGVEVGMKDHNASSGVGRAPLYHHHIEIYDATIERLVVLQSE